MRACIFYYLYEIDLSQDISQVLLPEVLFRRCYYLVVTRLDFSDFGLSGMSSQKNG